MRRAIRTRGHFPNDRAAAKLIYLALRGAESKWRAPPRAWLGRTTSSLRQARDVTRARSGIASGRFDRNVTIEEIGGPGSVQPEVAHTRNF